MNNSPCYDFYRNDQLQEQHLITLIGSGKIAEAYQCIETWQNDNNSFSVSFQESLNVFKTLCDFHNENMMVHSDLSSIDVTTLIQHAVSVGLLETADIITNRYSSSYHLSELIQALYSHGYIDTVRTKLYPMHNVLLSSKNKSLIRLLFIYGEIHHDFGEYTQAAQIFEVLVAKSPQFARARFGAASCYLHETMDNLQKRMALYHHSDEELLKIDKHISNITKSLEIIEHSGWHTRWTPEQQHNLPRLPAYQSQTTLIN
jgi:tetratricopeptide (TPR) repeat protein